MVLMFAGLALFLGFHSFQIIAPVRATLAGRLGEGGYKIVYSIVSLAGLILAVQGFNAWRAEGSPVLYQLPAWASHISLALMLPAFILLAATYAPGYIKRAVKHPMILAVKVWALAHLLANGDAAAVTLFGAFLVWAVVDRISVARRERAGEVAPRDFTPSIRADIAAVAIGTIIYALFVWKLHLWLIGVSPVVMSPAT